jgi:hypothetical protein
MEDIDDDLGNLSSIPGFYIIRKPDTIAPENIDDYPDDKDD